MLDELGGLVGLRGVSKRPIELRTPLPASMRK